MSLDANILFSYASMNTYIAATPVFDGVRWLTMDASLCEAIVSVFLVLEVYLEGGQDVCVDKEK